MKKLILLFPFLLILAVFAAINHPISEGVREAKLLKLSKKGIFVKSWEGQLSIFTAGEYGTMDPFGFSVHSDEVAKELYKHVGCPVNISYTEVLAVNPFMYDSTYDVTSFKCKAGNHNEH